MDRKLEDWKIGENNSKEETLGKEFVQIFQDFWKKSNLENKSKTTQNRYSGSLHALGGYLVEKGIYEDKKMNSEELLFEHLTEYDGPLIHYNNEDWQNELDMVSRKLYKFIKKS